MTGWLMRPPGPGEPVDVAAPHVGSLGGVISPQARLELLYDGVTWSEGPTWWDGRLIFSDVVGRRVLAWAPDGSVRTLLDPSEFANGHAVTPDGRLVQCEHGRRAISEVHPDGSTTVLATHYAGRRLNSPNDVAVARDGAIWFSDPTFGISQPTQGYPAAPELDHTSVYRLDPAGALTRMADLDQPNGLAFAPDESILYVSQTPPDGTAEIVAYTVTPGTLALTQRRRFATVPKGLPDGFLVDRDGRLWSSADGGVHVFAADGRPLAAIPVPGTVSNVAFDPAEGRLFLTGEQLWGIALTGESVVGDGGDW